jgi:hypothetical protein
VFFTTLQATQGGKVFCIDGKIDVLIVNFLDGKEVGRQKYGNFLAHQNKRVPASLPCPIFFFFRCNLNAITGKGTHNNYNQGPPQKNFTLASILLR